MNETLKDYTRFEELPDVITAGVLSQFLSLSKRRVYELMDINPDCGGIKCLRIGKSKRVRKVDLEEWINNLADNKLRVG